MRFLIFCISPYLLFANLAYVVNDGNHTVSVFDTNTGATVGSPISLTGTNSTGIAISPDGQTLYVANSDDNSVDIIRTTTNAVIHTISGGDLGGTGPWGIAISPDGQFAYVACHGSHSVQKINTSNFNATTISGISVGPFSIAISSNGTKAYVGTNDGKVYPISLAGPTVGTPITAGGGNLGIAFTPDGAQIYVVSEADPGTVIVINTSTDVVTDTITVGPANGPVALAITPNGETVYIPSIENADVAVISTASNTVVDHLTLPSIHGIYSAAVLPNGQRVYVTNHSADSVSVIQTSNNTVIDTITGGFNLPRGIVIASPPPPSDLNGSQKKDNSGIQYEFFNSLQWSPGPISVAGYTIYRNGVWIAQVAGDQLQYQDHDQKKGVPTTYSVASIDSLGNEGTPITTIVP